MSSVLLEHMPCSDNRQPPSPATSGASPARDGLGAGRLGGGLTGYSLSKAIGRGGGRIPVAGSPRRERAKARGSHPPASHLASPREAERLPRRGAVGEARPRPVHIGVGPLGAGALGRASLRSTPCPGLPPAPEGRCARPVPSHPSFPLPLGRGANPSAHFASPGLRTSSGSGEAREGGVSLLLPQLETALREATDLPAQLRQGRPPAVWLR